MRVTLRHLMSVALGLAVLSAVAGLLQQQGATTDPVLTSAGPPVVVPRPAAGPAPSAAAAGADPGTVPTVDARWLRRTSAGAGIPEAAVSAYARAVLGAPASCGLGWTTLAGIGWVESQHGTLDGRTLGTDGRPSTPVLGPPLDGVGPVAAIPATPESARLHGDPEWDHAIGPLQFIPSTWTTWGRDGDGDGVADPHDLDDAARAAAAYLCGTGHDLTTGAGWSAAVFAYNHSSAYVSAVHLAATTYAGRAAR